MKAVVDETYTPPLSDATTLMQRVRSSRPDLLLYITTTISDLKLGLDKMNEFHIGKGAIPVIGNGGANGAPEVLKNVSPELLEGYIFIVANWGLKGQEQIIDAFKKRTGEPWMTQDALDAYGHIWIFKDALEKVGSADKVKVAEAIHTMEFDSRPDRHGLPRQGEVRRRRPSRRRAARDRAVAERRSASRSIRSIAPQPRPNGRRADVTCPGRAGVAGNLRVDEQVEWI